MPGNQRCRPSRVVSAFAGCALFIALFVLYTVLHHRQPALDDV
jgi:hypothetical protein